MILMIFQVQGGGKHEAMPEFHTLLKDRYDRYLEQPLALYQSDAWFSAVKPYDSGIFPFMVMDTLIHFRGKPCTFFFGHDLLPFGRVSRDELEVNESIRSLLKKVIHSPMPPHSHMEFFGFGNRMDIGLNALSLLYMDILDSLTKVESETLDLLRTLQFQKHRDPTYVKTFGLQKMVAEQLGKSPVAIHKSLKSAKYAQLAHTATAMKEMIA